MKRDSLNPEMVQVYDEAVRLFQVQEAELLAEFGSRRRIVFEAMMGLNSRQTHRRGDPQQVTTMFGRAVEKAISEKVEPGFYRGGHCSQAETRLYKTATGRAQRSYGQKAIVFVNDGQPVLVQKVREGCSSALALSDTVISTEFGDVELSEGGLYALGIYGKLEKALVTEGDAPSVVDLSERGIERAMILRATSFTLPRGFVRERTIRAFDHGVKYRQRYTPDQTGLETIKRVLASHVCGTESPELIG